MLQFADRALEHRNLRDRIARGLEFRADLVLEIGGVTDLVQEQVKEAFGGQQTLGLQVVDGFIADRDVGAADVENDVVVSVASEPFESESLNLVLPGRRVSDPSVVVLAALAG